MDDSLSYLDNLLSTIKFLIPGITNRGINVVPENRFNLRLTILRLSSD